MSIINEALKKVQQGQAIKAEGAAGNPIWAPNESKLSDLPPIKFSKPAPKNKAGAILALVFLLALIAVVVALLTKQFNPNFPDLLTTVKSKINQLLHKNIIPATPKSLPPLAKITVAPQPASPAKPAVVPAAAPVAATPSPAPSAVPAPTTPGPSWSPVTLNVHGVMANGSGNVVLINDQVYQEGDEPVDGVKIIKIRMDSITVNDNGREETIHVNN